MEVVIYLLNGPGSAPKKSHVLRLGHSGRFAMNIVDDLVVVHHQVRKVLVIQRKTRSHELIFLFQATGTSLLFDIALSGETDVDQVIYHTPVTPGRPIKPFSLKLPSLSLDGQTKNCELCKRFFLKICRILQFSPEFLQKQIFTIHTKIK